jgi:hypothetical protein
MSDVADLTELALDDHELESLKPWARLFDQMTAGAPPPPGDRYTAAEFVDWLLLEWRSRSREQITARRRDERQIRQAGHQLRIATG